MTDRLKEQQAEWHLRRVFVNFLRAIATLNRDEREYEITYELSQFLVALQEVEGERQFSVVSDLVKTMIDEARNDHETGTGRWSELDEHETAQNQLVNSAAKIHAERISKTQVQLSRAETNFYDNLMHLIRAQRALHNSASKR